MAGMNTCLCAFLVACSYCAPSTFALSVDQRSVNLGVAEEVEIDSQIGYPTFKAADQAAFDRTFSKLWSERHAINKPKMPRRTPDTINVVVSVTNDTLPDWCDDIKDGRWGNDVSLSVYIKTSGLEPDEARVLNSTDRFEMIAIPNVGRNEHGYVWHLARKAPSFAGVEVFTKTNGKHCDAHSRNDGTGRCDLGRMVKYMVDVARNGSYESVSYPWDKDRRYLMVRCDQAWNEHPLYHDLCEVAQPGKKQHYDIEYTVKDYKYGRVPFHVVKPKVTTTIGPDDLRFALRQLPHPLPLIHETHGEGMFAVRRDVLNQYSASWYREWNNITHASVRMKPRKKGEAVLYDSGYDGIHHDLALMEIFPLLFGQATESQEVLYWVDDGCRWNTTINTYVGGYVQQTQTEAFARCCADDRSSCTSPQHCDKEQPGTYAAAAAKCSELGLRLCTNHELSSEVCCGTGGNCDNYPAWTSTAGAATPQESPAWLVSQSTVDLFDTVDAMMLFGEADRERPVLKDSWRNGYDVSNSMYAKSEYLEHPVLLPLPEW